VILLLLASLASAAVPADVVTASNEDLPEGERMAAFQRVVSNYPSYQADLWELAKAEEGDSRQRWIAIRVIGQVPSDESLDMLLQLCDDPQPAIRTAAVTALGDLGSPTAAAKIATMLTDNATLVRMHAADALGQIKDPSTVGDLTRALDDPSNYYRGTSLWVRRHYVVAMGDIGSQAAMPALIKCLDDVDPDIVDAALVSLKQIVGYDFSEGRSREEHIEAWRRWYQNGGR
jgi:HEAT repeat protein